MRVFGSLELVTVLSLAVGLGDTGRGSGGGHGGSALRERPSRVVKLKQGRVQGALVDLPLVSTSPNSNEDKASSDPDTLIFDCADLRLGDLSWTAVAAIDFFQTHSCFW